MLALYKICYKLYKKFIFRMFRPIADLHSSSIASSSSATEYSQPASHRKSDLIEFLRKQKIAEDQITTFIAGSDFRDRDAVKVTNCAAGALFKRFNTDAAQQNPGSSPQPNTRFFTLIDVDHPENIGLGETYLDTDGQTKIRKPNHYLATTTVKVMATKAEALTDTWSHPKIEQETTGGAGQFFLIEGSESLICIDDTPLFRKVHPKTKEDRLLSMHRLHALVIDITFLAKHFPQSASRNYLQAFNFPCDTLLEVSAKEQIRALTTIRSSSLFDFLNALKIVAACEQPPTFKDNYDLEYYYECKSAEVAKKISEQIAKRMAERSKIGFTCSSLPEYDNELQDVYSLVHLQTLIDHMHDSIVYGIIRGFQENYSIKEGLSSNLHALISICDKAVKSYLSVIRERCDKCHLDAFWTKEMWASKKSLRFKTFCEAILEKAHQQADQLAFECRTILEYQLIAFYENNFTLNFEPDIYVVYHLEGDKKIRFVYKLEQLRILHRSQQEGDVQDPTEAIYVSDLKAAADARESILHYCSQVESPVVKKVMNQAVAAYSDIFDAFPFCEMLSAIIELISNKKQPSEYRTVASTVGETSTTSSSTGMPLSEDQWNAKVLSEADTKTLVDAFLQRLKDYPDQLSLDIAQEPTYLALASGKYKQHMDDSNFINFIYDLQAMMISHLSQPIEPPRICNRRLSETLASIETALDGTITHTENYIRNRLNDAALKGTSSEKASIDALHAVIMRWARERMAEFRAHAQKSLLEANHAFKATINDRLV